MILGITGRTATGKSTLARIIEKNGFLRIDADAIYHGLLETSEGMRNELISEFESYDTADIYQKIKNDKKALQKLNEITHKYVVDEIDLILEQNKSCDIVLDVPVPVKRGFLDICDYIFSTDCSTEIQINRIVERYSITDKEAFERINIQESSEFFANKADFVICTDDMNEKDLGILFRDLIENLNKH